MRETMSGREGREQWEGERDGNGRDGIKQRDKEGRGRMKEIGREAATGHRSDRMTAIEEDGWNRWKKRSSVTDRKGRDGRMGTSVTSVTSLQTDFYIFVDNRKTSICRANGQLTDENI